MHHIAYGELCLAGSNNNLLSMHTHTHTEQYHLCALNGDFTNIWVTLGEQWSNLKDKRSRSATALQYCSCFSAICGGQMSNLPSNWYFYTPSPHREKKLMDQLSSPWETSIVRMQRLVHVSLCVCVCVSDQYASWGVFFKERVHFRDESSWMNRQKDNKTIYVFS